MWEEDDDPGDSAFILSMKRRFLYLEITSETVEKPWN
jgi:hypothetical protein